MYVSKEVDYALKVLSVLATHQQKGLYSDEISEQFQIPHNFITLLLPKLSRHHLIRSHQENKNQKPHYFLNRNAEQISVWDVLIAVGGDVELITHSQTDKNHAKTFSAANRIWEDLKTVIEAHLRQKTLADCLLTFS